MKERRFIGFRIATLLAWGIEVGMFIYFFREEFSYRKGFKDTWFDFMSLLIFFIAMLFQYLNFRMTDYLTKNVLPKHSFEILHLVLLVFNSIGTTGLVWMLCEIFIDFFDKVETKPNLLALIISSTWIIANSITIISSLQLRKYLRHQYEVKEQHLLESFGKS